MHTHTHTRKIFKKWQTVRNKKKRTERHFSKHFLETGFPEEILDGRPGLLRMFCLREEKGKKKTVYFGNAF